MATSAIVLAGGDSTRMGRDKASLPFGTETMLERVVRLVRSEVDTVIVAGRAGQAVPGGVTLVADEEAGRGPLAALSDALESVDTALAFVVACDMPLLKPAVVRKLITLVGDANAVAPSIDGHLMTTCAVVKTAAARQTAAECAASGERSLRAFLRRLDPRIVPGKDLRDVDAGMLSFIACNTPADYRRALVLAGIRPEE